MADSGLARRIAILLQLARSDDWSKRENGGFGLRDLMEQEFEPVYEATSVWLDDEDERVRRAVCLACMQRKRWTNKDRLFALYERLDNIMIDDALYVRKCCGPFVVGYLGYTYPEHSLPWLEQQAVKDTNLNRLANVAKDFSQALGRQQPRAAVTTLSLLMGDERHRVRSAVLASVRNTAKGPEGRALLKAEMPQLLDEAMGGKH